MVVYAVDATIDLEEAQQIVQEVKSIVDINKNLFGVTMTLKGSTATEKARNFFANDKFSQEITKAMALVIHQLPQRLMLKIYLKFNKPKSPIKAFKSLSSAMNWINTIEHSLIKEHDEIYS